MMPCFAQASTSCFLLGSSSTAALHRLSKLGSQGSVPSSLPLPLAHPPCDRILQAALLLQALLVHRLHALFSDCDFWFWPSRYRRSFQASLDGLRICKLLGCFTPSRRSTALSSSYFSHFSLFQTSRWLGCCCFIVQAPVHNTSSVPFRQPSLPCLLRNTTAACCIAWFCSCRSTLPRRTRCPTSLSAGPICRFATAVSASAVPQRTPPQPTLLPGPTRFAPSEPAKSVFCEDILQQLAGPACNRRCLPSLQGAAVVLTNHGLSVPVWGELVTEPPAEAEADPALHEPADLARGWQRAASKVVDDALLADLTSALDEASTALLHSQAGPFAGRVYTALPTRPELHLDSAAFRVLLVRRLRLPLPLDAAACRCGAHLDPFGDHRAACPRAGLLRGRGIPLGTGCCARMQGSWSHSRCKCPAARSQHHHPSARRQAN